MVVAVERGEGIFGDRLLDLEPFFTFGAFVFVRWHEIPALPGPHLAAQGGLGRRWRTTIVIGLMSEGDEDTGFWWRGVQPACAGRLSLLQRAKAELVG